MNLDYNLRLCQPDDLDKLIILIGEHTNFERADYNAEGKKENLSQALFGDNAPLHCIVVEVKGEIIGYATYTFDYSTWDASWFIYLDCIYIEENFRSYGIGAVLMSHIKEVGISRGCVNMQWQTPEFNERAIKFYNRIGGIGKEKIRFTLPLN